MIWTSSFQENSNEGRNDFLDSLKFYLICFVVLGHTLYEHFHESPVIDGSLYWIYSFHMPLFVFLSGYFSKKQNKEKYVRFLIRTSETLFLFQTVCIILLYLKGEDITWNVIISPYSVFWYLFSLIIWRSLIQVLPDKLLNNRNIIIIVTILLGLMAGFIPLSNELSFQRTFAFLPFFFIGYYSKYKWMNSILCFEKYKVFIIWIITMGLFFFLFSSGCFTFTRVCLNKPYDDCEDLIMRVLIWILAFGNGLFLIRFLKTMKFAAAFGALTLYIYVYHQFLVESLQIIINRTSIPKSLFIVLFEVLIVIVSCIIIAKIPFFRNIINPISYLFNRNKKS